MTSLDVNGVSLEYRIRGEGDPILFIMGLGAQMIDWPDEFINLFVEAGYSAITFDNRDIGLSSKTPYEAPTTGQLLRSMTVRRPLAWEGYTLTDMGDDAAGLLTALDTGPAHVVGVSMGGMIAQELSINHPGQVRSLCSIMSNTGDRKNGRVSLALTRQLAAQAQPSRETAVDDAVEWFRAIAGPHFDEIRFRPYMEARVKRNYDPEGVARQTGAIAASRDRTRFLHSVTAPTLVIHGLLDQLVLPSGGTATAKAIPNSRLLAFGDMAHDLPLPRWGEMSEAIVANFERAKT